MHPMLLRWWNCASEERGSPGCRRDSHNYVWNSEFAGAGRTDPMAPARIRRVLVLLGAIHGQLSWRLFRVARILAAP